MPARLTPTDALLALAAAQSPAEVNAARLALIETGSAMLRPLDRRGVLVGDGTAGHLLLGGAAHRAPDSLWFVARRAGMITLRGTGDLVCDRCQRTVGSLADRGPHHGRVCTACHGRDPRPVDRWLPTAASTPRTGADVSFALVDEPDLEYAVGGAR
ncbi:hypothetical protein [Cellulomonas palmilytica]|uniref:hypothetical protein n=1 Tax=Cellulomonas palmilytica TaxID=2608402 RepID=UPI001F36437B|nr:hypothetical protein [Cellulomonas palmilytica]UJP39357.1 hypothetical protein F1D97_13580 [Cellulomonas palmilytica]